MLRSKKRLPRETITAQIQRFSHDGRGITTIEGKTTFLFGGLPNEIVEFNYQRQHSRYDEGQVKTVINNAHPDRIQPRCSHFGVCGGCQLQHLSATAQLQYKQAVLLELLQQQDIKPKRILPPLSSNSWGYRRKARLSVKYVAKKDKVVVGFCEYNSHLIADIMSCAILHPSIGHHISDLSTMLGQLDARSHIPQIEIAVTDQISGLIIRHLQPLSSKDQQILQEFAKQYSLRLYLQPAGPSSVKLFYPQDEESLLYYQLNDYDLTLYFSPLQFIQINAEINQKMIAQALQLLALQSNDHVLDLFCGIGNFTLPTALYAKQVTGVEIEATAVNQAIYNAKLNNSHNCHFHTANLAIPAEFLQFSEYNFNKILLDPPRTGALEICMHMDQWHPQAIVYISCNPATLARDAQVLRTKGYHLSAIGAIDMFPETKHLEAMALFQPG